MVRTVVLTLLVLFSHFHGEAFGEPRDSFIGSVPLKIYKLMKRKHCSPVAGFYDRHIFSPPFTYIERLPGGDMVLFVCQIDNPTTEDKYKIVIMRIQYLKTKTVHSDFEKCPSEIYREDMPGGLSIVRKPDISHFAYNRWEDTRKHVWKKNERLDFDGRDNPPWIIDERAEGVGYGFFCAGSEWYHVSYD